MSATNSDHQILGDLKTEYQYGWSQPENYAFKSRKGLDHEIVDQISTMKGEPEWMRKLRHEALDIFLSKSIPTWGADLSGIDYQDIYYYIKPTEAQGKSWDDVPADIKETFDKLGHPGGGAQVPGHVGAQYESEATYHSLKEEWEKMGVIFMDSDSGLRARGHLPRVLRHGRPPRRITSLSCAEHGSLVGRLVRVRAEGRPPRHPLAGVLPHQRAEHGAVRGTLIIVDEGATVHYVEGWHRTHLLRGLVAQRRHRDHRAQGRTLPLHDHPELGPPTSTTW